MPFKGKMTFADIDLWDSHCTKHKHLVDNKGIYNKGIVQKVYIYLFVCGSIYLEAVQQDDLLKVLKWQIAEKTRKRSNKKKLIRVSKFLNQVQER